MIYEYECQNCGRTEDADCQPFHAPEKLTCPDCGSIMRKVLGGEICYRGGGWTGKDWKDKTIEHLD